MGSSWRILLLPEDGHGAFAQTGSGCACLTEEELGSPGKLPVSSGGHLFSRAKRCLLHIVGLPVSPGVAGTLGYMLRENFFPSCGCTGAIC